MDVDSGRHRNKKGQDRAELRADKEKLLEQVVVLTEKELESSAVSGVHLDDKKNVHDRLEQERRSRCPKKGRKRLISDSSAGGRVWQELDQQASR